MEQMDGCMNTSLHWSERCLSKVFVSNSLQSGLSPLISNMELSFESE